MTEELMTQEDGMMAKMNKFFILSFTAHLSLKAAT